MTEEQKGEVERERRFPFMTPETKELFYRINGHRLNFSNMFPNKNLKELEDIK